MHLAGLPLGWRLVVADECMAILWHHRWGRRWIGCVANQRLTTALLLEQVTRFVEAQQAHFPEDDQILAVARWTLIQLERYAAEQRSAR